MKNNPFDISEHYVDKYECVEYNTYHQHNVTLTYKRYIRRHWMSIYTSTFNVKEDLENHLFTIMRIYQKISKQHPYIENKVVDINCDTEEHIVATQIPIYAVKYAIYHHMAIDHG